MRQCKPNGTSNAIFTSSIRYIAYSLSLSLYLSCIVVFFLFPVTNITLLNIATAITHDILSPSCCFVYFWLLYCELFYRVSEECIIQLENEGAERNSIKIDRCYCCRFCIAKWHIRISDWMAVFVVFNIVFKIYGKNDIFKCFHHHFALDFIFNFLTFFARCISFVFVLRPPMNIFINLAFLRRASVFFLLFSSIALFNIFI